MSAFRIIRRLRDLLDVTFGAPADGDVVTYEAGTGEFVLAAPAASGAPTSADYLVGTANGGLSGEIVVGASPGGELGGSWAAPTVDATHSGSSHAGVQAAAEATAQAALTAHETDAVDAHAGTAISNTPAGNIAATTAQAAINELDSEKAAASHAHAGEEITSGTVADARIAATIARDAEVAAAIVAAVPAFATPALVLGTAAAAGAASTVIRSDSTVVAFDGTAPSTQAFGDAAAVGVATVAARRDHKHAMPADPATASVILLPTTSARNTIQPSGAAIVPLVVKGFAAQSADLQQWQDSTGATLLSIKNGGSIRMAAPGYSSFDILNESGIFKIVADFRFVGYGFYGGGNPGAGIALGVKSPAASDVVLVLRGTASQTADLQQWQNNGGDVLASVTPGGLHRWVAASEQTTVGAAGAASALPANPTKYLKVVDSAGTTLIIPAYAAA